MGPEELLEAAGKFFAGVLLLGNKSKKIDDTTGLPTGWRELKDDIGKSTYFYAITGQSTYTHPKELPKGWLLPNGWREYTAQDGRKRCTRVLVYLVQCTPKLVSSRTLLCNLVVHLVGRSQCRDRRDL